MRRRGFTLLELLAVIGLLGVLASILLPALARSREQARRVSCANNLAQLGTAFWLYAEEQGGQFPWSGGNGDAECLRQFHGPYATDVRLFMCPSSSKSMFGDEFDQGVAITTELSGETSYRGSYDYMGVYTAAPIEAPSLPRALPKVPLMWDLASPTADMPAPFNYGESFNHVPGGGNVLWLDGSVTFLHHTDYAAWNLPYRPVGLDYVEPLEAYEAVPAADSPTRDPRVGSQAFRSLRRAR